MKTGKQIAVTLFVAAFFFASSPATAVEPCCGITGIDKQTGVVTAQDKAGKRFELRVQNAAVLNKLKVGQAVDADFRSGKATIAGVPGSHAIIGAAMRPAEPVGAARKPAEPVGAAPKPAEPVGAPRVAQPATPQLAAPKVATPPPTQSLGSAATSSSPSRPLIPQPGSPQPPAGSGPSSPPGPLGGAPRQPAAGNNKPEEPCCAVVSVDTGTRIVSAQENATKRAFDIKVENPLVLSRLRPGQPVDADFKAGKASIQGVGGQFAIVGGPATARGGPTGPVATGERTAPGGAQDPKSSSARTAQRKTYALPSIAAGPIEYRSATDGRPGSRSQLARADVKQLRGMDEIDASALPESAKTLLMMHAITLPENASDHYIVDERLAKEWAKTRKVPADMKPKKKKKKKKSCDWQHMGNCVDKVVDAAEDLWDQANEDWRRAWRANTKNLAEEWEEAQECFADHTLSLGNIPIRLDVAPQFPLSMEKASSGKSASGKVTGTVTVGLPVQGSFNAEVEMFYIPCIPFAIRPKSVGADGTMTVAAKLGAQVVASGQFAEKFMIPPSGGPAIPVAVIPIVIGGIPVAILDVAIYVDGSVRVGGEGNLDGRFNLLAPYRNDFRFTCNGRGCRGHMKNVPVPTTTTEHVQVKGTMHVQPAIYTALQLSLNGNALAGRAGPQPYLYGEVRGCSDTQAMQNTSGASTLQQYHALSADLDWGIEFRAEGLVAGEQVASYVKDVMARKHLWFGDIAPGGSTAMSPNVTGPAQLAVNHAGEFRFASRPCYPYPDAVEYRVSWVGGATQSAQSAGPRPVAMTAPGRSSPTPGCSWQSGQGTCVLRPGADGALHLAWPQPGSYSVTVTPVKDAHGREFKSERATRLEVNVQ